MPGGQERALRRRIRSVQATMKITKAMELIPTSRIAKAQQRVAAARPYSEQITEVLRNLAAAGAEVRTVAYVVVAADRGLCGAYNSTGIRAAERSMQRQRAQGRQTRLVTVGKKATSYFRFRGWDIDANFEGFADQPAYEDARRIADHVATRFESGEYDLVELAYTQFLSVASQRV